MRITKLNAAPTSVLYQDNVRLPATALRFGRVIFFVFRVLRIGTFRLRKVHTQNFVKMQLELFHIVLNATIVCSLIRRSRPKVRRLNLRQHIVCFESIHLLAITLVDELPSVVRTPVVVAFGNPNATDSPFI